jgi:hypothetical protein
MPRKQPNWSQGVDVAIDQFGDKYFAFCLRKVSIYAQEPQLGAQIGSKAMIHGAPHIIDYVLVGE